MRISDSQRMGKLQMYQKQAAKNNVAADNKGNIGPQSDQINISAQGKELNVRSSDINEAASPEKINELKNSIKEGTYHVDPALIAAKMIARMYGEG